MNNNKLVWIFIIFRSSTNRLKKSLSLIFTIPLPNVLDKEQKKKKKKIKDTARKGQNRELNLEVLILYFTLLALHITKLCLSSYFISHFSRAIICPFKKN